MNLFLLLLGTRGLYGACKFTWFPVCDLLVCELILALSGRTSNNLVSSYIYVAILLRLLHSL
jgi:hypothetical protein